MPDEDKTVEWDIDANRPAEIIPMESEFEKELGHLLNKHSAENESGTPDFILAMFLAAQLDIFNQTIKDRAAWRGESVQLPALQKLHADQKQVDKLHAQLVSLVERGVIQVQTPFEVTDLFRDLMDSGTLETPSDKEVPLVIYTDNQRNEIGTATVSVTPGEVHASGKIIGVVPMFEHKDGAQSFVPQPQDDPDYPLNEPKDEPQPSSRFDRYQKKGLST